MLTQPLSLEQGSNSYGSERCLRDASFSSYLSSTEDCYVINLSKSFAPGDMEIDVFSAEKYFNESLDDEKQQVIKLTPVQDLVSNAKTKAALSGTSSVRSASSWNSQSALLQPELRSPSVSRASRAKERSYLGSFRFRCICSDKNSVAVDEYQSCSEVLRQTQSAAKNQVKRCVGPITAERQCMTNPGLKRETHLSSEESSTEDIAMKSRKSLEVFGLPLFQRGNKPFSFEMERKLTLNSEDEFSRPVEALFPTVTNEAYAQSDSDSSSDLFEIGDFTRKEKTFPYMNMSDSTMPPPYAPSEASIEWSVVTASAADFPVTSDYEELRPHNYTTINKTASKEMNQKATARSDKQRRLSNSFLACNSQNAVNVATNEKKAETKIRKSHGVPTHVNSAQMEAKLTRYETARNMQTGSSLRSLGQSKSLHGSNVLYFQ